MGASQSQPRRFIGKAKDQEAKSKQKQKRWLSLSELDGIPRAM